LFVLGCLSWKHQALLVKQSLALAPSGQGYKSSIDDQGSITEGVRLKTFGCLPFQGLGKADPPYFVSSLGKVLLN
jgi:hypothetical protein